MALPLALFALIIIGVLITAVFTIARLESRQGNASIATLQAFEAAETGLASMLGNWNNASYNALQVDSTLTLPTVNVGGGARYVASLRKMNATTFLARSEGQLLDPNGRIRNRREVVQLMRLLTAQIPVNAAITTRVGINITGSSQVSGVDSIPGGWGASCPPAGATRPGVRDSSGNVTTGGACSGASCIVGSPQIQTDPTVTTSSFTQFGSVSFASLAATATKVLSANVYNGIGPATTGSPAVCDQSVLINWGAPRSAATHPCFNYLPVIYHPGNVKLNGGSGQGILLVGGDLELAGGFEFFGPVIVMGRFRSTGTGGHIYGGLMANDADLTVSLLSGNSVVNFSSCAVNRALQSAATGRPLGGRSWAAVY
jgi:hypothetical protein